MCDTVMCCVALLLCDVRYCTEAKTNQGLVVAVGGGGRRCVCVAQTSRASKAGRGQGLGKHDMIRV